MSRSKRLPRSLEGLALLNAAYVLVFEYTCVCHSLMCLGICIRWLALEGQSAACRIQFSPSTTWLPRIGFRFSGLVGQAPFPAELSRPSWSPSFKTPNAPCQRPFLVLINYQLLILFFCVCALVLPLNSNS